MKKFFNSLLCILFFCGFAFSQSITVTNPVSQAIWYKGTLYTIRWTKSGILHAKVKIRLYNTAGTVKILNITDDTDNDGTFDWTPPGTLANGDYRIRVKTIDNAVYDDSDIFSIGIRGSIIFIRGPDLKWGVIQVKPAPRDMRDKVTLSGVVWNRGNTAVINPRVKLEIKGPAGFKTLTFNEVVTSQINPGASFTYTKKYYVTKHGEYQNHLVLDPGGQIAETKEYNNENKLSYSVRPLPDLIVCVDHDRIAYVATRKVIRAYVKNIGFKKSGACKLSFYIGGEGTKYYDVPELRPGQKAIFGRSKKLYKSAHRSIRLEVDYSKMVKEISERNNWVESRVMFVLRSAAEQWPGLYPLKCSDNKLYKNID